MKRNQNRRQLTVFLLLLAVNALLAFVAYALMDPAQALPGQAAPPTTVDLPPWVFGLANAGIVLVVYGLLGLAGYWISRRGLGLPGIFRERAGWGSLFLLPALIGFVVGAAIIAGDSLFASMDLEWEGFTHPAFPLSIVASATAGIGEEILFRLFVMSLWAYLLNLVLGRIGRTGLALWGGNLIGALAFGAGHLPAAMILVNAATPAEIPAIVLAELFLINGVMGLVAGWQFMRNGLIAAAGVHFWADILWHVVWPVIQ